MKSGGAWTPLGALPGWRSFERSTRPSGISFGICRVVEWIPVVYRTCWLDPGRLVLGVSIGDLAGFWRPGADVQVTQFDP